MSFVMHGDFLVHHYPDLARYLDWTYEDADRVKSLERPLAPFLAGIVSEFYSLLPTLGGWLQPAPRVAELAPRLRDVLVSWLSALLAGPYEQAYIEDRWRMGVMLVDWGIPEAVAVLSLTRMRRRLEDVLLELRDRSPNEQIATIRSLNKLLDLDTSVILTAFRDEWSRRQKQQERLAAIGQVAGGVAHELRNPLNVVRTSVYYLLHTTHPTSEKTHEHLLRIERQVETAESVIAALTNFVRLPSAELNELNLANVIEQAIEAISLPASIRLVRQLPQEPARVRADPPQLLIVLGNLVRNAIEAMPMGGTLTITLVRCGANWLLSVTDTGVGIAPEALPKVTEPLYTTKARGIGLGLAIVRAILERFNTALDVKSRLGEGSTFSFRLPSCD